MTHEEEDLLLTLIQCTTPYELEGVVPEEVILDEAKAHVRAFCQACSCSRQNPYRRGTDKPSIRYRNDYILTSRNNLLEAGYDCREHHLLQIMAVFYILLRRPNMRVQHKKFIWYIDKLCGYIDTELLQNTRESIYPYRTQILQIASQIDRINQPDLFWNEPPVILLPKPRHRPHPQQPVQQQTLANTMGNTNVQLNGGDFIADGGVKTITSTNNYITNNYYAAPAAPTAAAPEPAQPQPQQPTKTAGRPLKPLFVGADGKEDTVLRQWEQERVVAFLKKHTLYSRPLNCEKDDILNHYIIGFMRYWREKDLIAKSTPTAAVYRFLTNDCGLQTAVEQTALTNRWADYAKDPNYGIEQLREIRESRGRGN